MCTTRTRSLRDPQAGGISMIVALMLLVMITVGAMGMSKNAIRELAISGTSRQGAMARNVADSGIEWAVYWLDDGNTTGAADSALSLRTLKSQLAANDTQAGVAYDPITLAPVTSTLPTPPTDMTIGSVSGTTQGFTVALTRMGKLPITNMSQGTGPASFSPAQGIIAKQAPDLWALRSDSQVKTGTAPFDLKFFHAKEAWISTPTGN